jgi:hypothetical protein
MPVSTIFSNPNEGIDCQESSKGSSKKKASQMPRVIQGITERINSYTDCCRDEVGSIMQQVLSPEESQMPAAHSDISTQDKEQIKGAHLGEASETLAKTMFISEAGGALKSVIVRQNPTSFPEAIHTVLQMEPKWMQNNLAKARIQKLADNITTQPKTGTTHH